MAIERHARDIQLQEQKEKENKAILEYGNGEKGSTGRRRKNKLESVAIW